MGQTFYELTYFYFHMKDKTCLILFDVDERFRQIDQNKEILVRHLGFIPKLNYVGTKSISDLLVMKIVLTQMIFN